MAKPRGVKFQHRGSPVDNRRPSSDLSESMSESGSPNGDVTKRPEVILEGKEPVDASEYEKKKANFITRTIWTYGPLSTPINAAPAMQTDTNQGKQTSDDRGFCRRTIRRPYIYPYDLYGNTDHLIQRGHRHRASTHKAEEPASDKVSQLVLLSDYDVLSLR